MRKRIRLGFNIDHVATVRNARGDDYPSPLKAAIIAQNNGADSITVHLREDRRHIRDHDLVELKKKIKIPINLEMALTHEMLQIALKLAQSKGPPPCAQCQRSSKSAACTQPMQGARQCTAQSKCGQREI
jgi:hypothetical protein